MMNHYWRREDIRIYGLDLSWQPMSTMILMWEKNKSVHGQLSDKLSYSIIIGIIRYFKMLEIFRLVGNNISDNGTRDVSQK